MVGAVLGLEALAVEPDPFDAYVGEPAARAAAMSLPLSTISTPRGTTCRSQKPIVTVYRGERLQRNSRPDRTLLS
ncbi:MAG: hypothetical protein ABWZ91_12280 [Nocardioides sp.]